LLKLNISSGKMVFVMDMMTPNALGAARTVMRLVSG